MKVAIIDYKSGNVQSVIFALQRMGIEAFLTSNHEEILAADKVIFPGVGEASTTMATLKERKLDVLIKALKQPVLGICLGMQLLCTYSEENDTDCIGVFPLHVKKFISDSALLKIPHMGWNTLVQVDPFLDQRLSDQHMYFVHSYYVELSEYSLATCEYIIPFSAIIRKDNFLAAQFHPEKSGLYGQILLEQFIQS